MVIIIIMTSLFYMFRLTLAKIGNLHASAGGRLVDAPCELFDANDRSDDSIMIIIIVIIVMIIIIIIIISRSMDDIGWILLEQIQPGSR